MIIINLTDSNVNAYSLIKLADKFCQELNLDRNVIIKEMTKKDYGHFIKTFQFYFGDFVEFTYSDINEINFNND
jgi:hypothetical protein